VFSTPQRSLDEMAAEKVVMMRSRLIDIAPSSGITPLRIFMGSVTRRFHQRLLDLSSLAGVASARAFLRGWVVAATGSKGSSCLAEAAASVLSEAGRKFIHRDDSVDQSTTRSSTPRAA